MVRRCLGGLNLAALGYLFIVLVGDGYSMQAAPVPAVSNVKVVNATSEPIPTAPQGVTTVAGTLSLATGTTFGVTNASTTPLFVQLPPNNSQVFQQTVQLLIPKDSQVNSVSFTAPSAGTRVIIEEISAAVSDNSTLFLSKVQTSVRGTIADHFLQPFPSGVVRSTTTVEARRIYADPSSTITISFESLASNAYVTTQAWVTVSGVVE
jgi:hypothetical protein